MPYYLVECYEGVPSENVNQIKDFVRGNGGEVLEDFESFNGFSAEISEDLMARLESHEDVEDVEIDLLATYLLASWEEAPASPVLDDVVSLEKMRLIRHLGLETTRSRQPSGAAHTVPSLFFIESAPNSTRGAKCRLPSCDRMIQPGDLRLAMYPGMDQGSWGRPNAFCFEKIADFSRVEFLDRLQPLTRNTFKFRGVNVGGILDGNYLVSGGVERLVLEWKVTHG
ncbi:hypothetical protein PENFLA_c096G02354, partial [Penicillium flavigenum]